MSYKPIILIFSLALFMASSVAWRFSGVVISAETIQFFLAFSLCLLAALKFRDVNTFATSFQKYDLVAQNVNVYSRLYPYGEALAGMGMIVMGPVLIIAGPISLIIGSVGAISVIKAVYIDKRNLNCACVGGDSRVPLGFVSLTENLMMILMGIWMIRNLFY